MPLVLGALVVALAACGSQASSAPAGCTIEEVDITIHLGDSNLSCPEAQAMVMVMGGGETHDPEVIRGTGGPWTCTGVAAGEGGPLRRTCRSGGRSFELTRGEEPPSFERRSCDQIILGVHGRIDPGSSGLDCAEIKGLFIGIPASPGPFVLEAGSPPISWRCHRYPLSGASRDLLSCHIGEKDFDVHRLG